MVELFVYGMSCLYFVSVPRDCPTGHKIPQNPAIFESRVPGLGLNIRGTAGTGTDISGTVPRSLCPGTLVPGLKTRGIRGTVPCPSLILMIIPNFKKKPDRLGMKIRKGRTEIIQTLL